MGVSNIWAVKSWAYWPFNSSFIWTLLRKNNLIAPIGSLSSNSSANVSCLKHFRRAAVRKLLLVHYCHHKSGITKLNERSWQPRTIDRINPYQDNMCYLLIIICLWCWDSHKWLVDVVLRDHVFEFYRIISFDACYITIYILVLSCITIHFVLNQGLDVPCIQLLIICFFFIAVGNNFCWLLNIVRVIHNTVNHIPLRTMFHYYLIMRGIHPAGGRLFWMRLLLMNPLVRLSRVNSPVGCSRKHQTLPMSGCCDQCTLIPTCVNHAVGGTYTDFFYPMALVGKNKLTCQNRHEEENVPYSTTVRRILVVDRCWNNFRPRRILPSFSDGDYDLHGDNEIPNEYGLWLFWWSILLLYVYL